jgi:hypothetical protein
MPCDRIRHSSKLPHIYAESPLREGKTSLGISFNSHSMPYVGEAVMRVERMILAVVVSVLALFAASAAGTASADPDMTHNKTEMTHN